MRAREKKRERKREAEKEGGNTSSSDTRHGRPGVLPICREQRNLSKENRVHVIVLAVGVGGFFRMQVGEVISCSQSTVAWSLAKFKGTRSSDGLPTSGKS